MATEGMPAPHKPETTASTRFELCLKSGAEDRRPSARGLKPTSNAFDNFLWGQCILSHVTLYHSGDHRPSTASMEATPPQPQPQPFYKPLGRGRLRGFQGPVSPERLRPLRDMLRDWFRGLRSESGSSGTSFGRGSGVGGRVDGRGGGWTSRWAFSDDSLYLFRSHFGSSFLIAAATHFWSTLTLAHE